MPRYKRVSRDINHKAVMDAFKAAGAVVTDTAALGNGFPDLVVVKPDGQVLLVEVKTPENMRAGKIAREVEFMISHVMGSYRLVTTPEQAAEIVGL
jgi:hypothetical protein